MEFERNSIKLSVENRLLQAKQATNMGFYDWYPKQDKIIWDEILHQITELDPKSKIRRQEYLISIIHPEDLDGVMQDMRGILDPNYSTRLIEHNFRIILSGNIKYIKTSAIRELDAKGEVEKVYGIVIDTTSKVEAERKISENEERLRLATKASGFGTFDYKIYENHLYWDKRMREIFGYPENSSVDKNEFFFQRIHPDDVDRVSENYHRRMGPESSEESVYDEFRIVVDGEIKYVSSYGKVVRNSNNEVIRAIGTIIDNSEIKMIQRDLEESREYFRSIFEGSSDHIFTINEEREIVFINRVSPGLTMEEVKGTKLVDLGMPHEREMISSKIDSVFKKGKSEQYNTSYEGPEGTIYYSTRVSPLIDDGHVFGAIFITRDITELKNSEKKLKEQANELQVTNRNLEQFAYVSSHDIKAPITNLESLVKLMEDESVVKPEGKVIFSKVKSTIHQMKRTIKSLNMVFSVQSNLNLPKRKIKLEPNLKKVLESVNTQIEDSNTQITYDFSNAPTCNFASVHLRSIFQNLIVNSIKYRREGINPSISIISSPIENSNKVKLEISDNGKGFDLEKYGSKVFGLFQRFHLEIEGKGLGLHIIKMIIESYGGEISLKSKVNKGSKFIIII